ncbi:hypothetical protein G9A89_004126 [Geosiphon pyriformis]|nr:hypothetical protein G9A89_004126 [Geosiphon pyriformis]
MSGPSAKKRSARVLTTGLVGGGSIQKVKKSFSGVKLSSVNKNLKDSGPVSVDGQFTSMDMDGKASDEGKSATAKTQVIRKLFSGINGFGRATTPSKFEGIIRSTFTSSKSIEKTVSLARENNIIVNSDLKRQGICSDRTVLIGLWQKTVVEFAKLKQAVSLAVRWSFLIDKNSVCVAMVVGNCETWASRDQFKALLFTLPVGTTVHDLGDLLEGAGGKTCVINRSLETSNKVRCAVVCFDSDEVLESAFCMEPIFGGVKLSWAKLDLVCCERCGKFSYSALEYDAEVASALKSSKFFIRPANLNTRFQLAKLYAKKNVPISCSVVFGANLGLKWSQLLQSLMVFVVTTPPLLPVVNSPLSVCLALLEHSVKLLFDQISNILSHFDNIGSASLASSSQMSPTSVSLVVANSDLNFDMTVNDLFVQPTSFSPGVTDLLLGLSSFKVLTSKVGGLKLKLVALDISVGLILAKLD